MSTPGGVRVCAKRLRSCGTRRAAVRGFLAASVLLLQLPSPPLLGDHDGFVAAAWAAVECVGDCDGNSAVSPEELRLGVEIALGRANPGDCPSAELYSDGVTVDELVRAVQANLEGCVGAVTATPTPVPTPANPLLVNGRCRRPGASGLVACDAGFQVDVLRCDDRPTCLEATSPKTLLGNGPIGAQGSFSIVIDMQTLGASTMLVQAEAALQPATIYRILDIGSLGTGGGSRGALVPEVTLEIDPSSEGAMRTLDADSNPLGLDAFSNLDIQSLVESTRSTAGDYAGLTPEQAAQAAEDIASGLGVPRLVSFVASSGFFTYHAISSGAFAYQFTTLALTSSPGAADGICAVTSDVLAAGAVARFPPETNVVTKSPFLAGENLVFNPAGGQGIGRICVGDSCLSDASCPPAANDCQFFAYNENATSLSQGMLGIPDGLRVSLQSSGACVFEGSTFAFGTPAPTIHAEIESQIPMDGFALPPNTTIVFAQPTQPGGGFFAGVGGFRLRQGIGATVLSGAVAESDKGNIPPSP